MAVVERDGAGPSGAADPDDVEFAALRGLLIGPEREQLRALQARLDDPIAQARDVGRVLPQAMTLRAHDADLARALAPSVEQAITTSVRKNPQPLADALFPVIGPAIRRAVTASLAAMVETLNRTLEHSLSWRALRWRVTALRTGKSFAEIVLLNTLLYRVEQVFLIDRRTGLLLQHVAASGVPVQDADMVSGMLTAIRDFVADSFRSAGTDSLEAMQVGDLSVWVEQGPQAILAAVIRGTASPSFRQVLQQSLEIVHLQAGDALQRFDGDAAEFEPVRPILEGCLQAEYRTEARPRRTALWLVFAALVLGLGLLTAWWWRDRVRWNDYLAALRAEPGIVVVSAGTRDGKYFVQGLRDPLAREPATLLQQAGVAADVVEARWEPFQALQPRFVLQRARSLLAPPPGVTLAFSDGVLRAGGDAPAAWIVEAHRLAPLIAGVNRFDDAELIDGSVRSIAGTLGQAPVLFRKGTATPLPGQGEALRQLRAALESLDRLGRSLNTPFIVEVVGHADAIGDEGLNVPLSRARAHALVALLDASPLAGIRLDARGVGSSEPATSGGTEAEMQQNRRAVLRLAASKR